MIQVPYCLRVSEEKKIYEKLLATSSEVAKAPCAPGTLRDAGAILGADAAQGARELEPVLEDAGLRRRELKDTDPHAKTIQEYRDAAGINEGMDGTSTRFAYKVLSETFNFDTHEVAADPVHLMFVLEQAMRREQLPEEREDRYIEFIKEELAPRYAEFIGNEVQKAYLESYSDFGQNLFDRYVAYADAWIEDQRLQGPGHRPT